VKDLIFVLLTIGFFAVAALYVRACARIVGADESESEVPASADETAAEVTA
jgi:hypothetical protein